jgi:hypothetical protein
VIDNLIARGLDPKVCRLFRERSYDRKRDRAAIVSLQRLHRLRSVLERREYGLCVRKEYAPGFREHGSVPSSFQQGHP